MQPKNAKEFIQFSLILDLGDSALILIILGIDKTVKNNHSLPNKLHII